MIESFFGYGFPLIISGLGGSVAKARAAKVSIIKLTHSIYIEFIGESPKKMPPTKAINIATILTVSWNCRNFLMLS